MSGIPQDGNSWEKDVKRWLRLRHPNDFQEVPATDGGDAGIEGFCISERCVYQCYAVQNDVDTKTLYESQRDKLTTDIGKFVNNRGKLGNNLPPGFRVQRYCYIVPEFRSRELVSHAQKQTKRVRDAALPYAADDFAIIIQGREEFEAEQKIEQQRLLKELKVDVDDDVDSEKVDAWLAENDSGVQNLSRKIPLFTGFTNADDIANERRYWIERKICTDNALHKLRLHAPDAWERLWTVKTRRERLLGREFRRVGTGVGTVEDISDRMAKEMLEQVPNLAAVNAETLAEGLVGEWLQNCKLNFPAKATS